MKSTEILRSLSDEEILQLENIANSNCNLWESHLPKKHIHLTALKEGQSIHFQMLTDSLIEVNNTSKKELFPNFYQILVDLCKPNKLGRAYIHKLKPGTCIEKHNDRAMTYMKFVKKRMQMYVDIPDNCVLLLDNKIQDTERFKYKYIDFAYENDHYYYNGSNKDWIFCVFDVLNNDLE